MLDDSKINPSGHIKQFLESELIKPWLDSHCLQSLLEALKCPWRHGISSLWISTKSICLRYLLSLVIPPNIAGLEVN
jgi:hypothetical protein